jgi:hypothetical protein
MKRSVRFALFEYKGLELVILSKPFKTKKLAEKARLKYPDRVARKMVIPFVTNAFVDLRLVETFVSGRKEPPL